MDGIVKIGKTSRDPQNRVFELSGATGVPTPFVLVYYSYFDDCSKAESYIHTMLEQRGLRVAGNREFFNMPINEAINFVIEASQALKPKSQPGNYNDDDFVADKTGDDFLDGLSIEITKNPWEEIMMMADAYYYGYGEIIEDPYEAFKLYKQAMRLGSPEACLRLAHMHRYGESCEKNNAKALEYLKEGARRNNYYCYAEMYEIFYDEDHFENARKCWDRYVDNTFLAKREDILYWYQHFFNSRLKGKGPWRLEKLEPIKNELLDYAMKNVERYRERSTDPGFLRFAEELVDYIADKI